MKWGCENFHFIVWKRRNTQPKFLSQFSDSKEEKNSPLAHCYSSSFKLFHLVQTYVYSFERLRRRKKNSFETLHFRFNFPHPTQTKVKSPPREGHTVKFPNPRPQIVVKWPRGEVKFRFDRRISLISVCRWWKLRFRGVRNYPQIPQNQFWRPKRHNLLW